MPTKLNDFIYTRKHFFSKLIIIIFFMKVTTKFSIFILLALLPWKRVSHLRGPPFAAGADDSQDDGQFENSTSVPELPATRVWCRVLVRHTHHHNTRRQESLWDVLEQTILKQSKQLFCEDDFVCVCVCIILFHFVALWRSNKLQKIYRWSRRRLSDTHYNAQTCKKICLANMF